MATKKAQQQAQEAKADEAATDTTTDEPKAQQSAADGQSTAPATGTDSAASSSSDDGAGESGEAVTQPTDEESATAAAVNDLDKGAGDPSEPLTVLILRDETVAGVDYQPGDTPTLPGSVAQALIDRRVADDNPKAVAAARRAQGTAGTEDEVIE
ncbi:hypothetical protein [Chromohalobacter israelensis]|uniref:hypothetical protein n=1 Tax=Chromohalobacter israelensis TaxID=141390 RepID=UPI00265C7271|nr:hypothetical protein [Chromohalobacter salexigens]MDO0945922.1 hypothetical protein [Chromohalobacter salexigens]